MTDDATFKRITSVVLPRAQKTPRAHQLECMRQFEEKYWAWLLAPRLGKTYLGLNNFFYLYHIGEVKALIVIAPSGVHRNWSEYQCKAWRWPCTPYFAHAWTSSERSEAVYERLERRLADKKVPFILTVNKEAIIRPRTEAFIRRVLLSVPTMLIVDESHHFSNPENRGVKTLLGGAEVSIDEVTGKKTRKVIVGLARHAAYRRILSGTPALENSLQLWPQYEILEPGALGCPTFSEYKETFTEKHPWGIERINSTELHRRLLKCSTIINRGDCPDLPPLMYETHTTEMCKEQRDAYDSLASTLSAEIAGTQVTVSQMRSYHGKFQQISSGFLIDKDGVVHYFKSSPKLEKLIELIEISDGPVIVWAWYRAEEEMIRSALSLAGIDYLHYSGGKPEREKAYAAFRPGAPEDGPKVLIGQHARMSEGLDLGRAGGSIHTSVPFSAVKLLQANERTIQTGGDAALIQYLTCAPIDAYILKRHEEKAEDSASVMSPKEFLATLR